MVRTLVHVSLIGLVVFACSEPALAHAVPFAPTPPISTSANKVVSVAAADLDGDGDLDVVSAAENDDDVEWHENDGAPVPGWTTHTVAASLDGARSVHLADLDGDGDLDILSAAKNDDTVAWYENDGASTSPWTERVLSASANGAWSVHASDLDGDGDMDVLAAARLDDTVLWYRNDGGLPPQWTEHEITFDAARVESVFAADVDGDGDPDVLAAAANDDKVAWYENDGASASPWVEHAIASSVNGAASVHAADFDLDGDLDVVAAALVDDEIYLYVNQGGTWSEQLVASDVKNVHTAIFADVDVDGALDILSAAEGDDQVLWYELDASGTAWIERVAAADPDGPVSVLLADVDGDADPDVLCAASGEDRIAWYDNLSIHRKTIFGGRRTVDEATQGYPSMDVADVDGDGDLDGVYVHAQVPKEVIWAENPGTGSAEGWTTHVVWTPPSGNLGYLVVTDIDADGDVDVAVTSSLGLKWFANDGNQPPGWTEHDVFTAGDGCPRAADLDDDGDIDFYTCYAGVRWLENQGGDPPRFVGHQIASGFQSRQVASGDIDGDGDRDVAVALDGGFSWFANDGSQPPGWTAENLLTGLSERGGDVAVVDLNGDGFADIVGSTEDPDNPTNFAGALFWFANDGSPTPGFTQHTIASNLEQVEQLIPYDVDEDGDMDVLATNERLGLDDPVLWFENGGGLVPSWTEHHAFTADWNIWRLATGDVDRDGDLDLLVSAKSTTIGSFGWNENCRGQYTFLTEDTAPSSMLDFERAAFLETSLSHNGLAGEPDIRWNTIRLLLESDDGQPLSQTQANARIDELALAVDDGSGVYEDGIDNVVWAAGPNGLVDGVLTAGLPGTEPALRLSALESTTYFLTARLAASASQQAPPTVRITHLTDDGVDVSDLATGVELVGSCPDVGSTTVGAVFVDSDGDGSPNLADCAPGNPLVYPNAPEINDGIDQQCPGDVGYGAIDEVSGVSGFINPTTFCWEAQSGATAYEVVRSSFPDFSADCTSFPPSGTCITDTGAPPFGAGYYYIVRAVAPLVGSWGLDSNGNERMPCP